jgi:hypothetical protein
VIPLGAFIQRFSQVRNTISRISNAYLVVAFRQGVRDEKMLEKLATHDIQDVAELFNLADRCARATEGCAWYAPPRPEARKEGQPDTRAAAQGSGNNSKNKNNNKTKASGNNQPLAGAPTAAAATAGGDRGPQGNKHPRQASSSNDGDARCPVHNSTHHSTRSRSSQNSSAKGSSNRARKCAFLPVGGKQKVDPEEGKDEEFQNAKRALKAVYGPL